MPLIPVRWARAAEARQLARAHGWGPAGGQLPEPPRSIATENRCNLARMKAKRAKEMLVLRDRFDGRIAKEQSRFSSFGLMARKIVIHP
jgi:hypothetical protein